MKYTRKLKNGILYNPPKRAIDAGIVQRKFYPDGRGTHWEIRKMNEMVEAFDKGEVTGTKVTPKSKLIDVINYYHNTKKFLGLSVNTQRTYSSVLKKVASSKTLKNGKIRLDRIDSKACRKVYDEWLSNHSVAVANENKKIFSMLMNFCRRNDLIDVDPMSKVESLQHEPETVEWNKDQVEKFITTAFTDFKWRNLGLIVLMCYDWCQRPVDIRNLTWDSLDLEAATVSIKQTKRGAKVTLPINKTLLRLLKEQKKDFGFQQYVVPNHRPQDGAFVPYSESAISRISREIKEKADLPNNLEIGSLRKTGINEMLEAGVPTPSLMSVTGHKRLSSLNPYVKHRLETAKEAMIKRGFE